MIRDITETIRHLPSPSVRELPKPLYNGERTNGVCMAVESMKSHMTDEGWQIMQALNEGGGYTITGARCPVDSTDVPHIIALTNPGIVFLQDKREWDVSPRDFRDKSARFANVHVLREHSDIFKLTILKDSHQRPEYHRESAEEIGCHAWVVYYAPRIVKHLAPYVRSEHLVRTYHSLDPALVPDYSAERQGCLLSGAVSGAYPLRSLLAKKYRTIPDCEYAAHPGYHRNGCQTPSYLRLLSRFKVAICTSSMYGYALRKIIEATACGCTVITDLPSDEVLPEIDCNLVRIPPQTTPDDVGRLVSALYASYESDRQEELARRAKAYYNYVSVGQRLAADIESLRASYNKEQPC